MSPDGNLVAVEEEEDVEEKEVVKEVEKEVVKDRNAVEVTDVHLVAQVSKSEWLLFTA